MSFIEVVAATMFAAFVFAVFAYTAYVAYLVLLTAGEKIVYARRRRKTARITRDPYQATLRNIERLERELGDDT